MPPARTKTGGRARGRRAGELTAEEVERLVTIVQNPRQFKVPDWMLNRKKDNKDGKYSQVVSNTLDMKLRDDLERLKKIRAHRGLRHYCAPPPDPRETTAVTPSDFAVICPLPALTRTARAPSPGGASSPSSQKHGRDGARAARSMYGTATPTLRAATALRYLP